jgi:hypothetical protein
MLESIMGDPPTPLKRRINGAYKDAEMEFVHHFHPELENMLRAIQSEETIWVEIAKIVKFCDCLEATQFLIDEMMLGNFAIRPTYLQLRERVIMLWPGLPFGIDMRHEDAQEKAFKTDILPLIEERPREWEVIE